MAKYDERPDSANPFASQTVVKTRTIPDAIVRINGGDEVDVHAFVRELLVSDKIIMDYLRESEEKLGCRVPQRR